MNREKIMQPFLLFTLLVMMSIYHPLSLVAQEMSPNVGGNLEWNPDGTRLAIIANNGVFIYDRSFQLLHHRQQEINNYFAFGGWNSDGTKLLVGNQILNAETLEPLAEVDGYPRDWMSLGNQVFGITSKEIRVFDANNGILVRTIPLDIQIEEVLGSPDGTRVATTIANSVFIFDLNQQSPMVQYLQPVDIIGSYVWSPDSSRIAYSASRLVPMGTQGSVPTTDSNAAILNTLNIMDVNTGEVILTSEPTPNSSNSLAWSNNIPLLAGLSVSGSLYVWDTTSAKLLGESSILGQVTGRISYSPYGGVIAVGMNPETDNPLASVDTQIPAIDSIQIVVPDASFERLAVIQDTCNHHMSASLLNFAIPQTKADLSTYIDQIRGSSTDQVPPGCAADLIAVAEALQAEQ